MNYEIKMKSNINKSYGLAILRSYGSKVAIIPFFMFMFFVPQLRAQKVEYVYDAAGNCTQRKVITLPKSSPEERGEEKGMTKSAVTDSKQQSEIIATVPPKYEDMLGERKIVIYPNPTQGLLRIECQSDGELKDARLLLYDMQGRLLRQVNKVEPSQMLDLTPHPAGIYILQMIEGAAKSEWKIVKE